MKLQKPIQNIRLKIPQEVSTRMLQQELDYSWDKFVNDLDEEEREMERVKNKER